MWVFLFPEGTFTDQTTIELVHSSQKFAAEKGWPVHQHVLVPRTKGFLLTVNGLRGHAEHVCDMTFVFKGTTGSHVRSLLFHCFD
jgi:hypothetical protein